MTYEFLLESVWHPPLCFAETSATPLPSELELQALWFAGAFGRDFRTTCGKSVRIIQFGEWNRGAGPDFIRTAVEIDGEPHGGPLELDPDAAAWEAHGHAVNPAFRDVVLHVVFQSLNRGHFTRTCEHREVPQVLISEMQLADALNRPQREVAIAHPGRCVYPLKHLSTGAVSSLLDEAAVYRANLKAARWLKTEDVHGRDAALFQATAETLGYRGNALAMRLLAQRAPLALLKTEGDAAEAVLFGTAGFLSPDLHEQAPPETREYLRGLWDAASAPPTIRTGGLAHWPRWSASGRNTAGSLWRSPSPSNRSPISCTSSGIRSGRTTTRSPRLPRRPASRSSAARRRSNSPPTTSCRSPSTSSASLSPPIASSATPPPTTR
ncbi:MAG: DUF2851 family protein [Akkermansiaceae bacterium]|nr:DUF2851 family protein [Akkermansiaceae bacterium]